MVLHHMGESICSQRVRLVLAEKGLPWRSVLVEPPALRSPSYLALNPAGVVPTLEHDGAVLTESRLICEYLEEVFSAAPLTPQRPLDRHRMRRWTKACDDGLYLAVFVLTFMVRMRGRYLDMPGEARAALLPGRSDPIKRRIACDLLDRGWDSDIPAIALSRIMDAVDQLEQALEGSRWIAGEHYSLADVDLLTVMQRLDDLGLAMVWEEHARAAGWLDRARHRPSFTAAFEPWKGGAGARIDPEPFARLLLGVRGSAG